MLGLLASGITRSDPYSPAIPPIEATAVLGIGHRIATFKQTVSLLSEYVQKTGDDYHGDAAKGHLQSVIENLEQRLR